jgi:predicted enzyme related to lactoylglutathione lyase
MSLRFAAVTFDCTDAARLAEFWSAVLDRPMLTTPPPSPYFAALGPGPDGGSGFMFIQVPEGKTVKNRVHLDLDSEDPPAEVARVVALGATKLYDVAEYGLTWTTLTDPEGNEFCIGTPHH